MNDFDTTVLKLEEDEYSASSSETAETAFGSGGTHLTIRYFRNGKVKIPR